MLVWSTMVSGPGDRDCLFLWIPWNCFLFYNVIITMHTCLLKKIGQSLMILLYTLSTENFLFYTFHFLLNFKSTYHCKQTIYRQACAHVFIPAFYLRTDEKMLYWLSMIIKWIFFSALSKKFALFFLFFFVLILRRKIRIMQLFSLNVIITQPSKLLVIQILSFMHPISFTLYLFLGTITLYNALRM